MFSTFFSPTTKARSPLSTSRFAFFQHQHLCAFTMTPAIPFELFPHWSAGPAHPFDSFDFLPSRFILTKRTTTFFCQLPRRSTTPYSLLVIYVLQRMDGQEVWRGVVVCTGTPCSSQYSSLLEHCFSSSLRSTSHAASTSGRSFDSIREALDD